MQLVKFSSLILIFIVFFTSCQDDPTSLGKDLIGDQLEILIISSDTDTLAQNSSSFVTDSLNFGSASRVLLGNLEYVKSTMLLRFGTFLPDSISDALEDGSITVLSSEVELRPIYRIGDRSQILNFSVHEITSSWGSSGFNADSLAMLTYDPVELTSTKEVTDSLIKFDVNTAVALKWLNTLRGDTSATNYGMILIPTGGNLLYGFRAFPLISQEDSPFIRFVIQNSENKIDTISAPVVFDVHIPEGIIPAISEDRIQLTAGLGQRGILFFDLSKLPPHVNINKAELTLNVDSTLSYIGSPDTDSLRLHLYSDSTNNEIASDQRGLRLYFDGKQFKGDIARFVQAFVSGKENQGMSLTLSNEISAVDKYVVYGSKFADQTLRPKLVIYYNVFN
ncbi:MAG: hypothetical protein QY331_07865 [Melioribacteraceae bacterium]|nr:MAG: hypothetical protein QY331_07865 [Melioribacteraceae bacterium]